MDDVDDVVLLSPDGAEIGRVAKSAVHGPDTPLHLALSCYLLDDEGRVLVTRRSLGKRAWPGVWTNSFCGHPFPGEPVTDAVRRHAMRELGVRLDDLRLELPLFRYRATDPAGVVEHEVCPVYTARIASPLDPSPAEVMDHVWMDPADLARTLTLAPWAFSPWMVLQVELLDLFQAARVA